MKNSPLLFGLSLGVLLLSAAASQAQWKPDVRLTNDPADSYTHDFNNGWCIASSGDVVHVAWFDSRDGNQEIYYKRSTNGGVSWGADTRLTNDPASSAYPSVAVSGSIVHVVWRDDRDGNKEIYHKRSTDGGTSWGADTRLTNDSASSWYPSVSVLGVVVHVVWMDDRDGNHEAYYIRSTDDGLNWGTETRLTNDPASSGNPTVSVSSSVVHVAWTEGRDGNSEIYYKRSTDGGASWGADTRLTNNSTESRYPSIAVSGSVVHIVWRDDRDGNNEIYYKYSTDGGVTWGTDTRLTNNTFSSEYPSVAVSGSDLHVSWHDLRDGNYEIYYKRSTNGGTTWGTDTRLTKNSALSASTSVAVSGQVVHVLWRDHRDGNPEIYYKRNPGQGHGKLTAGNVVQVPADYLLAANFPNPFNPATRIVYALPEDVYARLVVYDILGHEVTVLVDDNRAAGQYEVVWDGTSQSGATVTSGVYFYRLTAGSFTQIRKMLLMK